MTAGLTSHYVKLLISAIFVESSCCSAVYVLHLTLTDSIFLTVVGVIKPSCEDADG